MMASSVNLGSYLQTELQALSGEARRKHPEVKEAAERVLVILRGAKSNSSSDGSIASFLQQSDEIVRPFALACQSSPAGGKLASMALQGVQQLVAARAVSSRSVGEVLDTLRAASAMGVEVQVKALQTVLPLVTLYGEVAGERLVEALHVCVALQRSRDGVVGNTAAAILRQAVEEVFERVAKDKQGEEDGELAQQHVHDAQFVLQDLCLLAGDGQPVLLQQARGMDRLLVLELLEAILASHASAVMAHAPMVHVLRERLAPHLVGYFADPSSASFALSVRSIRVLTLFIQHMHAKMPAECEVFLGILARLVDGADGQEQEDGCCWRVLALESVRRVGGQGLLLLFERYDAAEGVEDCHVVGDLVASVARVAALYDGPEVVSDTCDVRRALRTLLDKHAAPRVSPAYAVSQALHTVAALADALALSLLPSRTRHVLGALEVVDRPGMQGESHGALLLQHTWPALLPALDRLLGAPLDGYMFSRAVDTAGRLLCTCGALRLVSARDALLAVLCAHADTQDAPGDAQRQTRCLREALQSAQYLAAELGSQWSTVLCAVQRHAQGGEDVPGEVHEVLRVARCAGRDAYLWVLRGLVGLGCATGGVPVPEGIAGVNVAREPADRPLLSTVLLRDLCVATDGSADALLADADAWRLLTDHLLTLATHPAASDAGRAQAAATLCAVVLAGVHVLATGDCPSLRPAVLQPLARLMEQAGDSETRRAALDTLHRAVQAGSPGPWHAVFDVVHRVFDRADGADGALVRAAFPSVRLVCSDYLAELDPEGVRTCVHALVSFGRQHEDINVALAAVGQAWALCDFLHARDLAACPRSESSESSESEEHSEGLESLVARWRAEPLDRDDVRTQHVLWSLQLHALSTLARDPRPDVRLCAVQTLFRALDAHGAAFPASRWPAVWAVVLPLVQHVLDARARAFASHDHAHPGDDEERRVAEMSGVCLEDPGRLARRQWDEAAETALRGAAGVWAHVRCTERAFVDLWEHVARLAAGSLDPLADAEARAVLRSRQSLAAALECMHVLGDPTLLTSPERRTVPWTAWHRVCLALLTVPAHASTKLNQDAQGFAVVRHDTLCTLLDLGVRLAAVLQDAGELVREQCAALVHVSRAMLMYCEPAETPPREDARVGRLQRLALDAVSLVERGEGLLALRELSLLAAAPYALFLDAPAAGDALLAQRVVGSTREAFGAQLKRAAQLAAACGRPVPSLSALGVAAAEQLVHVAGRLAPEALAPGWQDAVAALALHMVRPVGAPDCFVNAVPEAMLRLQGHGGLQDAWASVALALEHVLGLTASGSTTVHAASEQHVLVLDAVVQVTLQSAQHSQVSAAQPPSELSAYWTRILHVLSCGASLNEGALPAACFRWLLHMCGAGELPTWVSRGAAPVLVKRCRRLVGGFVRERELVGCRAPMPLGRVRLLQGVLEGLAVMECRKGALADETALDTAEVDEDTALDKHTTGVEKDTADVDKDTARPCNNAVAMAKSAVIVALFGALVDLLPAAHASGIVAPVQQCLRRVQHELLG